MDEHREAREELEAIQREDRDQAREHAESRAFAQDEGLSASELVTLETWRWSQ
jgi:hypothetical protein